MPSSSSAPAIPTLPLLRASTAASTVRLGHLPTPTPSARKVDLGFPAHTSSLSGLVGLRNAEGARYMELLSFTGEMGGSNGSAATTAAKDDGLGRAELEKARRAGATKCAAAIADITSLSKAREAVLKGNSSAALAHTEEARAAAAAARREEAERLKREEAHAAVDELKKLRKSRSAAGRVELRLAQLSEDDALRDQLQKRCELWKRLRADGRAEALDYVKENRLATRTLSSDDLLARKSRPAQQWAAKVVDVRSRLHKIEEEREAVRAAREQAILAESHVFAGSGVLAARGLSARGGGTGGGSSPPPKPTVSLKHQNPRERAAALKIEAERRNRWLALVVLGARASACLDELMWDRNHRQQVAAENKAASMIQSKHMKRVMRHKLEHLHKSCNVLRQNVAKFAFLWRVRRKVRAPGPPLRPLAHGPRTTDHPSPSPSSSPRPSAQPHPGPGALGRRDPLLPRVDGGQVQAAPAHALLHLQGRQGAAHVAIVRHDRRRAALRLRAAGAAPPPHTPQPEPTPEPEPERKPRPWPWPWLRPRPRPWRPARAAV